MGKGVHCIDKWMLMLWQSPGVYKHIYSMRKGSWRIQRTICITMPLPLRLTPFIAQRHDFQTFQRSHCTSIALTLYEDPLGYQCYTAQKSYMHFQRTYCLSKTPAKLPIQRIQSKGGGVLIAHASYQRVSRSRRDLGSPNDMISTCIATAVIRIKHSKSHGRKLVQLVK